MATLTQFVLADCNDFLVQQNLQQYKRAVLADIDTHTDTKSHTYKHTHTPHLLLQVCQVVHVCGDKEC